MLSYHIYFPWHQEFVVDFSSEEDGYTNYIKIPSHSSLVPYVYQQSPFRILLPHGLLPFANTFHILFAHGFFCGFIISKLIKYPLRKLNMNPRLWRSNIPVKSLYFSTQPPARDLTRSQKHS